MKFIAKIEKDKLLHLVAGIYIYLLARLIFPQDISYAIVIVVAILKEVVYDKALGKGSPEVLDVIYTIYGALSMLIFDF